MNSLKLPALLGVVALTLAGCAARSCYRFPSVGYVATTAFGTNVVVVVDYEEIEYKSKVPGFAPSTSDSHVLNKRAAAVWFGDRGVDHAVSLLKVVPLPPLSTSANYDFALLPGSPRGLWRMGTSRGMRPLCLENGEPLPESPFTTNAALVPVGRPTTRLHQVFFDTSQQVFRAAALTEGRELDLAGACLPSDSARPFEDAFTDDLKYHYQVDMRKSGSLVRLVGTKGTVGRQFDGSVAAVESVAGVVEALCYRNIGGAWAYWIESWDGRERYEIQLNWSFCRPLWDYERGVVLFHESTGHLLAPRSRLRVAIWDYKKGTLRKIDLTEALAHSKKEILYTIKQRGRQ